MEPPELDEAVSWMLQLNRTARDVLVRHAVHAVTDVTGFGLPGHALEMARASRATLRLELAEIPVLQGAIRLASIGMLPGGIESNAAFVEEQVRWLRSESWMREILLDPQTSGGLLVSLPSEAAREVEAELRSEGLVATPVGAVLSKGEYLLEVF